MNIVQLHERIRFWVDIVSSTRFESEDLDNGLNVAIDNKVRESYDQNMPMNRSDAFQRVQRVRDELGPLVKKAILGDGLSVGAVDDEIILGIEAEDYRHLLALKLRDHNGGWHPCFPITYDRKNVVQRNPFRRVRTTPNSKSYYSEREGDIVVYSAFDLDVGEISNATLDYLANPLIVNWGVERDSSYSFSNGEQVIAIEETRYAGVTYVIGQKFTITTVSGLNITLGRVVHQYVECDVRGSTHEEISRRAAINLLLTADEKDKALALRQEITAQ